MNMKTKQLWVERQELENEKLDSLYLSEKEAFIKWEREQEAALGMI